MSPMALPSIARITTVMLATDCFSRYDHPLVYSMGMLVRYRRSLWADSVTIPVRAMFLDLKSRLGSIDLPWQMDVGHHNVRSELIGEPDRSLSIGCDAYDLGPVCVQCLAQQV